MSLNNLYSLGACSPSGYVYPPPGGLPPYFPVPGEITLLSQGAHIVFLLLSLIAVTA